WKYSGTGLVRSTLIGPLALGSRSGIFGIPRVIRPVCLYILTTAEFGWKPDRYRPRLALPAGPCHVRTTWIAVNDDLSRCRSDRRAQRGWPGQASGRLAAGRFQPNF